MESKIPEIEAREILLKYEGFNNQLLEWKKKFLEVKNFNLTRPQCDYVLKYHETTPKVARKYINIVNTFGEKIMDDRHLTKVPDKVWCEKLLCESDKAYHIWGKITENEKNYAMWLPKAAVIQEEKKLNREIDYSKYHQRPPMEHQKVAIEKLLANDKYILADDQGLGKTTSAVIGALESGSKKILIICPASLKINWQREIENYSKRKTLIVEGGKWGSTFDFYIINYDIIKNYHSLDDKELGVEINRQIVNEKFDLCIVDECFTYDSKIMTEYGEMMIGDIVEKCIDVKILTYNFQTKKIEYKNIDRWIRKNKDTIYQIELQNGVFIECTDNHKFYTENRGYVKAKELTKDDKLYLLSESINKKTNLEEESILFKELRIKNNEQIKTKKRIGEKVYERMSTLWKNDVFYNRNLYEQKEIMFKKLFFKNKNEQSNSKTKKKRYYREKWWLVGTYEKSLQRQSTNGEKYIEKNEREKSNVQPGNIRKNEKKHEGKNFFIERRSRSINRTTKIITSIIGGWLGTRVTNQNKGSKTFVQMFTKCISSGYWKQKIKNIGRSRWEITQVKEMGVFGQKENRSIKFIGVESIEILERGSYDKSQNLFGKDTRVYDLEIRDNHNYFINNILVSNCHMISNPTAQRTKLINDIVEKTPKVWLLSGTPMTSRPINYYNLLKIVNSPLTLNWQSYVKRYCAGYQFRVNGKKIWNTNGASNLDELRERTKNVVLRRMKTDVLDLPEKIITPVFLELKSTFYDEELENFMRITSENKNKESISVTINRLMKIRQVIAFEKIPYTCELIDKFIEQGKKVIVFTNFTMTLDMLHEKYKKNSVVLDGRMSKQKRQESIDRFQNEDKIKIFIGNIKAAGVGITLTAAEGVIMNDLSFVPADHSQAEDRCVYGGQSVITSDGYKKIENVKIGDLVYTHNGNFKKVINTHTHLERKKTRIDIESYGFEGKLSLTHDHKIFVYNKTNENFEWVESGDIDIMNHCLTLKSNPQPKEPKKFLEVVDYCHDIFENNLQVKQKNGRLKKLPNKVELTDELLYSFGFYIAEGWSIDNDINNGKNSSTVNVCQKIDNKKMYDASEYIISILKKSFLIDDHTSYVKNNIKTCTIHSKNLSKNFNEWFGIGSENKKLPDWVNELSEKQLTQLLNGYFHGDGYHRKNIQNAATVSSLLSSQLVIYCANLGKPVSLRIIEPKEPNRKKSYNVEFNTSNNVTHRNRIKKIGNYITYPINSITKRRSPHKDERVYDISVEDDHSFVVNVHNVHNCYRYGQKNSVIVYYPIYENTIEKIVYNILQKKKTIIDQVMGDGEYSESFAESLLKQLG
jgi:intein/homing endonuclease